MKKRNKQKQTCITVLDQIEETELIAANGLEWRLSLSLSQTHTRSRTHTEYSLLVETDIHQSIIPITRTHAPLPITLRLFSFSTELQLTAKSFSLVGRELTAGKNILDFLSDSQSLFHFTVWFGPWTAPLIKSLFPGGIIGVSVCYTITRFSLSLGSEPTLFCVTHQ